MQLMVEEVRHRDHGGRRKAATLRTEPNGYIAGSLCAQFVVRQESLGKGASGSDPRGEPTPALRSVGVARWSLVSS
jgi:hypothetical protein